MFKVQLQLNYSPHLSVEVNVKKSIFKGLNTLPFKALGLVGVLNVFERSLLF